MGRGGGRMPSGKSMGGPYKNFEVQQSSRRSCGSTCTPAVYKFFVGGKRPGDRQVFRIHQPALKSCDPHTNGDNHVRTAAKATTSGARPRSPRQTSAAP